MGISPELAKSVQNRIARHKDRRIGATKQKVLLLLAGGLALGLSGSPGTSWKILGKMVDGWKNINKQSTERAINSLYASQLVEAKENPDGTFSLTLSEEGRKRVLTYNLLYMKIPRPRVWDKKWRLVSFDIPESQQSARNAFRKHLLRLGFYEQHRSFLIYPFDCSNELEYLIELHDIRKYVQQALAVHISNEMELRKFFTLS
ncbi:MAG: hypothetical protein COV91_05330 [Candidatus Taylorbacteria bacterium CG11_big_fil_rev_8_21_14_0_20_46_11]|uniref:Transcriptional repressor PaaX-like central Cas2-like domain-containing protein n=1 Tax=Candidatus Taylorbacteria bacterium CG11_big_fil_rev_8_21_14_0_20_46_11 TaxID=1975025 RepID=A0A2H0KAE7_9BACT|nr:MAG: hypothetical protein COV91_05330 [Candidatus Taylorbacteria bacterium CG11_big_fil_rev_8_21_14_0_20_46_11]